MDELKQNRESNEFTWEISPGMTAKSRPETEGRAAKRDVWRTHKSTITKEEC